MVFSTESTPYEHIVDRYGNKYGRRCINGLIVSDIKCVGVCQYEEHPGCLTEKLRREHNCIDKNCPYYIPKEKRSSKYKKDKEIQNKINSDMNETLAVIQQDYDYLEGIKFHQMIERGNTYVIRYYSITKEYDMKSIEAAMSSRYSLRLKLEQINCSYETRIQAIYK